jgi:hypothetical protein
MDAVAAPQFEITDAGERLRSLITDAERRGTVMVSAGALQSRLFEIYDAAAASADALEMVQRHLTLTLGRTWFSAAEVSELADQIDWALSVGSPEDAPA